MSQDDSQDRGLKLSGIDDPIAEDHWEFEDPDGKPGKIRIVVGRPAPLREHDWYTPISIEGFTSGITPVLGVGPADSLMNAMALVRSAFDRIHRRTPGGSADLRATLQWLTTWYREQCDGFWEHERGIVLQSLDNPGWLLRVNIEGTDLASQSAPDRTLMFAGTTADGHPCESSWLHCRIRSKCYEAAGDPEKLLDILLGFRSWAVSHSTC